MKAFKVTIKNSNGKRTITINAKCSIDALLVVIDSAGGIQDAQIVARPA